MKPNFIEKTEAGKTYIQLTKEGFDKIFPIFQKDITLAKDSRAIQVLNALNSGFKQSGMSKVAISAFLGQVSHESGGLKYFEEIADGKAYEGRQDLGNVNSGDGSLFKGRGPMMITGRRNYAAFQEAINKGKYPFLKNSKGEYPILVDINSKGEYTKVVGGNPKLLATNIGVAIASTFWYWEEGYKITMANDTRKYPFVVDGKQEVMTPADYMKKYFAKIHTNDPARSKAIIDAFDQHPLSYAADNGLFGIVTGAINAAYNHAPERVSATNFIRTTVFQLKPMATTESNIAIPRKELYDIIKANRQNNNNIPSETIPKKPAPTKTSIRRSH